MTNSSNYFNSKEFKENLTLFEKHRKEGTFCILSSDELADISEYYFEKGQLKNARETAEYAVSVFKDATAPLLVLARYYISIKKDKDKAKEYIKKIKDCRSLEYFIVIAEYYIFTNKKEKAFETLEYAKSILQDEDKADFPIDAAAMLIDYGLYDEANRYIEEFDGDKETDNDYLNLKARISFCKGNYDQGYSIIERLIDKDPFNAELWKLLATEQNAFDKYAESATSSEYAIAIDDTDAEAYLMKGNAYFKMCNYSTALEAYSMCTKYSDSELAYMMIGRCYFCLQDMDKALYYLKIAESKCTESTQNKYDIYRDFAIVYGWSNRSDEAFEYLNRLKDAGCNDAETYLIEGGILLGKNELQKANEAFSRGYEKSGNPHEYTFQVAVSFYEHGNDMSAYLLFEKVFEEEPERTRGLAYITACCIFLGMKEKYISYLKLAVEKNPEEAQAVLAEFFPQGMLPCDYVEYAIRHANNGENKQDGSNIV